MNNSGTIEVICGPMFSGKTEELIRRLVRAQIAKKTVRIFKHSTDNRYSEDYIVSHNKNKIKCHSINNANQIIKLSDEIDIIGIDEAQFFDKSIIETSNNLANKGKRIIMPLDKNTRPLRDLVKEYLQENNFIVSTASDAEKAKIKISHFKFLQSLERRVCK